MLPLSVAEKLLSVLSPEQVGVLADSLLAARDRAVGRRCIQSVEIHFNEKGFPRHISASDSVFLPAPGKYLSE